jgi:hypothetical protein
LEPFLNGLRKFPQLVEETGFLLYLYIEEAPCCKQSQSSLVVEHGTAKWRVYGSSPDGYFINVLIYFYAVHALNIAFKVSRNGPKMAFWRANKTKCFPEIALKVKEGLKESGFRTFP